MLFVRIALWIPAVITIAKCRNRNKMMIFAIYPRDAQANKTTEIVEMYGSHFCGSGFNPVR